MVIGVDIHPAERQRSRGYPGGRHPPIPPPPPPPGLSMPPQRPPGTMPHPASYYPMLPPAYHHHHHRRHRRPDERRRGGGRGGEAVLLPPRCDEDTATAGDASELSSTSFASSSHMMCAEAYADACGYVAKSVLATFDLIGRGAVAVMDVAEREVCAPALRNWNAHAELMANADRLNMLLVQQEEMSRRGGGGEGRGGASRSNGDGSDRFDDGGGKASSLSAGSDAAAAAAATIGGNVVELRRSTTAASFLMNAFGSSKKKKDAASSSSSGGGNNVDAKKDATRTTIDESAASSSSSSGGGGNDVDDSAYSKKTTTTTARARPRRSVDLLRKFLTPRNNDASRRGSGVRAVRVSVTAASCDGGPAAAAGCGRGDDRRDLRPTPPGDVVVGLRGGGGGAAAVVVVPTVGDAEKGVVVRGYAAVGVVGGGGDAPSRPPGKGVVPDAGESIEVEEADFHESEKTKTAPPRENEPAGDPGAVPRDVPSPVSVIEPLGRTETTRRSCAWCGMGGSNAKAAMKLMVCSACKSTYYCGAECQTRDWIDGGHGETCRRASSAAFGSDEDGPREEEEEDRLGIDKDGGIVQGVVVVVSSNNQTTGSIS